MSTVLQVLEDVKQLGPGDQERAVSMIIEFALQKFGRLVISSKSGMPVTGSLETPEEGPQQWRAYLFRSGEFRRGYYYRKMSWEAARATILATFPPGSDFDPDKSDYYQGWLWGNE